MYESPVCTSLPADIKYSPLAISQMQMASVGHSSCRLLQTLVRVPTEKTGRGGCRSWKKSSSESGERVDDSRMLFTIQSGG